MYGFRDVNETSDSVILPSEAMQINGEYIENLVEGYRTLSVSGRESLSRKLILLKLVSEMAHRSKTSAILREQSL